MKQPDANHPITIEPHASRVRVIYNGTVIADTHRALALREASLPVTFYIPRDDARMDLLTPTPHSSHCPYKGDAAYFSVSVDGRDAENAVWSYEVPYPAVAVIKDRLAFYPNRVDTIETVS